MEKDKNATSPNVPSYPYPPTVQEKRAWASEMAAEWINSGDESKKELGFKTDKAIDAYYYNGYDDLEDKFSDMQIIENAVFEWQLHNIENSKAFNYVISQGGYDPATVKDYFTHMLIHGICVLKIEESHFNHLGIMDDYERFKRKELVGHPEIKERVPGQEQKRGENQVPALLKKAENGVKNLFESERYKTYLKTMSNFHHYSARNTLLILLHRPDASRVAGYEVWKEKFNRHVQRGEKGIPIIGYAPKNMTEEVLVTDKRTGLAILDATGNQVTKKIMRQIPSFKTMYVYDVNQTKGEPLPSLEKGLTGNVSAYQALMKSIQSTIPYAITFESMSGNKKGYCNHSNKFIAIKEGMSEGQTIKTAIHEIAHAGLHAHTSGGVDRQTEAFETDSVAYVVCSHYGLDTSDYSFSYLASWSSNKDLIELQGSLDKIQKQANTLIEKIDKNFELLQNQQEKRAQNSIVSFPNGKKPDNKIATSKCMAMKDRMEAAKTEATRRNIDCDVSVRQANKNRQEVV